MPYVKPENRLHLDTGGLPKTTGDFNYVITKSVEEYLGRKGLSSAHLNEVIGALVCAKLESYRRVVAEYENKKIVENTEVYTVLP